MNPTLLEGLIAIALAVCEKINHDEAETIVRALMRVLTGGPDESPVSLAPEFAPQVELLREQLHAEILRRSGIPPKATAWDPERSTDVEVSPEAVSAVRKRP